MAGYSKRSLPEKLGIKPGETIVLLNGPANYRKLLGAAARSAKFSSAASRGSRFVHLFVTERSYLEENLRRLRQNLADDGTIWVSWPKQSSGVETDVTEDTIRDVALPLDFVDVKVCAVDDVWSGLKLVIRREHRNPKAKQ